MIELICGENEQKDLIDCIKPIRERWLPWAQPEAIQKSKEEVRAATLCTLIPMECGPVDENSYQSALRLFLSWRRESSNTPHSQRDSKRNSSFMKMRGEGNNSSQLSRVSFMGVWPVQPHRDLCSEGTYTALNILLVPVLKFLILFLIGIIFSFCIEFTNYITGLATNKNNNYIIKWWWHRDKTV